jgi:hypothetical protein
MCRTGEGREKHNNKRDCPQCSHKLGMVVVVKRLLRLVDQRSDQHYKTERWYHTHTHTRERGRCSKEWLGSVKEEEGLERLGIEVAAFKHQRWVNLPTPRFLGCSLLSCHCYTLPSYLPSSLHSTTLSLQLLPLLQQLFLLQLLQQLLQQVNMAHHNHGPGKCSCEHDPTAADMGLECSLWQFIQNERVSCLNEAPPNVASHCFKPWDQRLDRSKVLKLVLCPLVVLKVTIALSTIQCNLPT